MIVAARPMLRMGTPSLRFKKRNLKVAATAWIASLKDKKDER